MNKESTKEELDQPLDWPLRWLIKSETKPGESYLVDLGANDCIGSCQCRWYVTTVRGQIKAKIKNVQVCQHVIKAEIKFKKWAKHHFRDLDPNPEDEPPLF